MCFPILKKKLSPMNNIRGKSLALSFLSVLCISWLMMPQGIARSRRSYPASNLYTAYQSSNLGQLQRMALALANRDRTHHGRSPLQSDALLSEAAQRHAEDMLRRHYFSHYSPEGRNPSDRFAAVGGRRGAAENIMMTQGSSGVGYNKLAYFEDQWMHSSRHRQNLLNSKYGRFGYGIASSGGRVFAVQLFTSP
jgi:uncharacterized protein YkwD